MTGNDSRGVTRRAVLGGTAGGLAAGLSLGAVGTVQGQSKIDSWLSDTSNYDGTIEDWRGQDEVTIDVGVGNTGLLFGPPAVRIDPGTTVIWEWTGDGGNHNVHAIDGADFQSKITLEPGFTFEQTIESEGAITYQCDPHATVGMKGALVVGDIQIGTPDVRPDFGGWLEGVDGGYLDARGQDEVTVSVGAEGNGDFYAFEPAGLWIDPGTDVVWEWTGDGGRHNVRAMDGADFESELTGSAGVNYFRTITESGIITYQCDPHSSLGMKGAIAVGDDVPTIEVGGEEEDDTDAAGPTFRLPGGDPGTSLVLAWFGITGVAALSVLASEAREFLAGREPTASPAEEAPPADAGIVREVGHEEFQPVGTAVLIAVYFLILVGLWVFVYFIEFLGNDPSVIG